jgi:sodium transport system permease protein
MRWSNVWVIFRREVRDQLRDRRTLFMIFVVPILLYPLLGLGVLQLSVAFEQKPRTVVVVGAEYLPESPKLLNATRDGFDPSLFDTPGEQRLLGVMVEPVHSYWSEPAQRREGLRSGLADAVVVIPPNIRKQIEDGGTARLDIPYSSADERSQITYLRVRETLARWNDQVLSSRLKRDNKPPSYTEPVKPHAEDVAGKEEVGQSVWARLFPFLLVMMSLTGAFYPAIDLCAGEKERGTMETLLISPASRSEIVIGKFLTVVLASMVTALLNLASMGLTGAQLASSIRGAAPGFGHGDLATLQPPSLASAFWMVVLLVPLSVFFSSVCLALAVLAKSMKEGQYYMTPLYLVAFPLIFISLAPGVELNLFYSLVPITGVALLLRALMQRDYATALHYFLPVLVPTIVYGAVALRWAVDQFQREGVLFREAERFDIRIWLKHLLRDKEPTPTAGEAVCCFAIMLTSAWFLFNSMSSSLGAMAAGQIAFILTPPLAMGFMLTSDPWRTLRLRWPAARYLAAAIGLAFALNPLVNELGAIVNRLFPLPEALKMRLNSLVFSIPDPWTALLLLALVPAVCEEIAFRGYILSGLERTYRVNSAVLFSALLFGFLHVLLSLFQQLFNAVLLGLVLGLIAVRSRSILPGIVFHFLNNAMGILRAMPARAVFGPKIADWLSAHHAISFLYRNRDEALYRWHWVGLGALCATFIIAYLRRSPARKPEAPIPEPAPLAEAALER